MNLRNLSARQSLTLIVITAAIYTLWEILAHNYLMFLPMMTWHWLSGGIATLITLAIAAVATRAIRQQERKLEGLARLKDDLTRTVVQDLRAPLMATMGSLETIKTGNLGQIPEEAQEMIDIALDSSRSLAYQVNDLLDIA